METVSDDLNEAFDRIFNSDITGAKMMGKMLVSLTDLLSTYKINFTQQGLNRINYRSIEVIETIYYRLQDGYVVIEQVQQAFGEWLGILAVLTPNYIITLESLIRKVILKSDYGYEGLYLLYEVLHEGKIIDAAKSYESEFNTPKTSTNSGTRELMINYLTDRKPKVNIQIVEESEDAKINSRKSPKAYACSISDEKLTALWRQLIIEKCISEDTTIYQFQEAFKHDFVQISTPILWIEKTALLVYLLSDLEKRFIITGRWQNYLGNVKKAFLSKKKTPITNSNFSSSIGSVKTADHKAGNSNIEDQYIKRTKQIFDKIPAFII